MSKNKSSFYNIKILNVLNTTDVYSLMILFIFTILNLVFYNVLTDPSRLLGFNLLLICAVVLIATIEEAYPNLKWFSLVRNTYIAPMVYMMYLNTQNYIKAVNPNEYDLFLIELDRMIFGLDPTVWMMQFSHPIITEILQICYFSFFFLPIIHSLELYLTKREEEFSYLTRNIMFGFYFSYLLYFLMPAIGPRFYLHDFLNLNADLPGLFLTEIFRDIVNSGGGVPAGVSNPEDYVNRDCMPSGHTMLTLVNIIIAWKFKSKTRWIFYIVGSGLILSTIYLTYHYVVDLLAGALCAGVSIWLEPKVRAFIVKIGFKKA